MSAGTRRRVNIRTLLQTAVVGNEVVVNGWVKTSRFSKNVSFVHLFDGSTPSTVQVILDQDTDPALKSRLGVGTSVKVVGTWVKSPGGKQDVEISAQSIHIIGDCDGSQYPMQRKRTSLEFLRTIQHLRPRSNTHQAAFRVRNALSHQIHRFFQDNDFLWIHTPIITPSDAEGAGELFPLANAQEFFGTEAFMTVSGQLQVECFAQSHTDVYTFGPTFRAERSNTPRHAAEFWMIEPEMAFADLNDDMTLAEEFIKGVTKSVMEQCSDDLAFFDKRIEKGLLEKLQNTVDGTFHRITHDEAQGLLLKSKKKFEYPIGIGCELQTEHERFLAEEHFKGPVFVTDYPKEQKAFYMRNNADGRTVAAMDLLMPRIGEMIGGSQREERLDELLNRMKEMGVDAEHMSWYVDLRRFGTTPHAGFGLGFERMLMWMTGISNIRDVIPFPRVAGQISI